MNEHGLRRQENCETWGGVKYTVDHYIPVVILGNNLSLVSFKRYIL